MQQIDNLMVPIIGEKTFILTTALRASSSDYLHRGELLAVGPVHGGDGLQVQLRPLQVALKTQVATRLNVSVIVSLAIGSSNSTW